MLRNIKLLSLDATNTLIRLEKSPAETYTNFAKEFGFQEVDKNSIGDLFIDAFKKLEKQKPCYGFYGAGEKSWWTDLMRKCYGKEIANSPRFPLLADQVFDFYRTKDAWCLTNEKNLDKLCALSSRGLKIAVISNFDHRLLDLLDAFKLTEFIDHIVISGDVGFQKPEPEIFELVLKHFKIRDRKLCLHIGDSYEKDFLPATKLGMNSLLYAEKQSVVPISSCIQSITDLNFE